MSQTKQSLTKQTKLAKRNEETPAVQTPFGFLRRFAEDMERMFDDFEDVRLPEMFGKEVFPFRMGKKDVEWIPQIEVIRNNGKLTVRCDLPGMKREDVNVELKDEVLTISGERNEEKKEEREGYYRSERNYGSFYRQVPLPAGVKTETAEATFRDGVLEIRMVAAEKEAPVRKLEIKESTAEKPAAKAAAGRG